MLAGGAKNSGGTLVRQPHAVVGEVEPEALGVHAKRFDREDDRLAVTLADAMRGAWSGRCRPQKGGHRTAYPFLP